MKSTILANALDLRMRPVFGQLGLCRMSGCGQTRAKLSTGTTPRFNGCSVSFWRAEHITLCCLGWTADACIWSPGIGSVCPLATVLCWVLLKRCIFEATGVRNYFALTLQPRFQGPLKRDDVQQPPCEDHIVGDVVAAKFVIPRSTALLKLARAVVCQSWRRSAFASCEVKFLGARQEGL